MRRKLIFIGLVLIALATVAGTWRMRAPHMQSPGGGTKISASATTLPEEDNAGRIVSQPAPSIDPRAARRKATDYLQLVNLLLPLAHSGSAAAQYELASALHYCDENWRTHFFSRSTGAARTPEEMRQLYAKLSESTQHLLDKAYQRCHSFGGDVSLLKTSSEWLDQAVNAGYPQATFMKADLMLQNHVVDGDSAAIVQARHLAINASTSGDPGVLFGMADFVDGAEKSREQAAQLIAAWWLLGCESGYDCSAESEASEGICTVDPQCANKPTVVEELQRTNGAKFGEIQLLAEQIKAAVDSRDPEEIKKYL